MFYVSYLILLHLSDLFEVPDEHPCIEMEVEVLNINAGKNTELMNVCNPLHEYSVFTQRSREALKVCLDEDEKRFVLNHVIDDCIQDGILEDFLKEHKEDIIMAEIWEYDAAEAMAARMEEDEERARADAERARADAERAIKDAELARKEEELAKKEEEYARREEEQAVLERRQKDREIALAEKERELEEREKVLEAALKRIQ